MKVKKINDKSLINYEEPVVIKVFTQDGKPLVEFEGNSLGDFLDNVLGGTALVIKSEAKS